MNWIRKRVRDWWMPACLTLFLYIILRCIILVGYVPSESMEPTLPKNSIIVGNRLTENYAKGDIIIFHHDGLLMVKRIAALPGEMVLLDSLEYMDMIPKPKRGTDTLIVPEGCYYVLGDNTQNSLDSRYWEDPYVQKEQIVARLFIH